MSFAPSTTASSGTLSPPLDHAAPPLASCDADVSHAGFPPNALDLWLDQMSTLAPPPLPAEPCTPPTSYRAMLANLLTPAAASLSDPSCPMPPNPSSSSMAPKLSPQPEPHPQPSLPLPPPPPPPSRPIPPRSPRSPRAAETSPPSSPSTQPRSGSEPPSDPLALEKPSDCVPASDEAGLSAVERAKRSAEAFTMSQLSRKRKTPPTSTVDGAGEDNNNASGPEHVSHRKYQKRLQKNRDSAFVSRIRRREYTRLLETSLSAVEKEKDAAVAAYREMKRRFDVVTAELMGIKTATVVQQQQLQQQYHYPQQQQQPTLSQQPVHAQQAPTQTWPLNGGGGGVTTMYMFALVVGALIPGVAQTRMGGILPTWGGAGGTGNMTTRASGLSEHTGSMRLRFGSGSKDGMELRKVVNGDGEYVMSADASRGTADKILDVLRDEAVATMSNENAEKVVAVFAQRLRMMLPGEVEDVRRMVARAPEGKKLTQVVNALAQRKHEGESVDEVTRLLEEAQL